MVPWNQMGGPTDGLDAILLLLLRGDAKLTFHSTDGSCYRGASWSRRATCARRRMSDDLDAPQPRLPMAVRCDCCCCYRRRSPRCSSGCGSLEEPLDCRRLLASTSRTLLARPRRSGRWVADAEFYRCHCGHHRSRGKRCDRKKQRCLANREWLHSDSHAVRGSTTVV